MGGMLEGILLPAPFMSDYKTLLANALRSCPNIYPEPLDVAVAMMGGRSGFEWGDDGELMSNFPLPSQPMDYADLDEAEVDARANLARHDMDWMKSHYMTTLLETQAARMRRQFIDENMDMVVQSSPVCVFFREDYHLSSSARQLVRGEQPSYENSAFLHFPDNITPQWGEVVRQFQDWVEMRMNQEFGVSISGQDNHWPEAARRLKQDISASRARLHPLMHGGESYEDHLQKSQDLSRRLIDEIIAEENATSCIPSRRRAP